MISSPLAALRSISSATPSASAMPCAKSTSKPCGVPSRALLTKGERSRLHDAAARQPHRGDGALARRAVDDELAAMQLGHRAGERQSEAGALIFAREPAVDLAEGAQRFLEIMGGDADAGILDDE